MADPETPIQPDRDQPASPEQIAEFMNQLLKAEKDVREMYEGAATRANLEFIDAMKPPWFPQKLWRPLVFGVSSFIDKFRRKSSEELPPGENPQAPNFGS